MPPGDVNPAGSSASRIAVVDDDDLFRETLAGNLKDANYDAVEFNCGQVFLDALAAGRIPDLVLLDWKMPGLSGIEVLREVRRTYPDLPVIFLTVLGAQIFEEAALLGGAVDFIEKSRSFTILSKRIERILASPRQAEILPSLTEDERAWFMSKATQPQSEPGESVADPSELTVGFLRLDTVSHRAYWRKKPVELTLTEFGMVQVLAGRVGKDVPYRDLYDVVHGKGFHSGGGEEGYRANVRTAIKRIRQKFKDVDEGFDQIDNYPGFGYSWLVDNGKKT
jgi:two-component system response regulator ChvI